MFGIGAGELMVLLALALIVIGPQKLPETARTVGKTIAQFRAYTEEIKETLNLQEQLGLGPTSHMAAGPGPRAHSPVVQNPQADESTPAAKPPLDASLALESLSATTTSNGDGQDATEVAVGRSRRPLEDKQLRPA